MGDSDPLAGPRHSSAGRNPGSLFFGMINPVEKPASPVSGFHLIITRGFIFVPWINPRTTNLTKMLKSR